MKSARRYTSRPWVYTAAGIALAVVAGLLLLGYLSRVLSDKRGGPEVEVFLAARDIEAGTLLDEDCVKTVNVPGGYVVPGSVESREMLLGNRSLRFLGKGEPFTEASVSGNDRSRTLASRIPDDHRAYTIITGRISGANPELRPGDRVDVLSTAGDPPVSSTILKGRIVLETGREGSVDDSRSESRNAGSVTLLVTPGEAEMLAQAECTGEISVSLCPP